MQNAYSHIQNFSMMPGMNARRPNAYTALNDMAAPAPMPMPSLKAAPIEAPAEESVTGATIASGLEIAGAILDDILGGNKARQQKPSPNARRPQPRGNSYQRPWTGMIGMAGPAPS